MFKKDAKIIYPNHGAGIITKISEITMDGMEKEYYDIEFKDSQVSISIPVESAEGLGLQALPSNKIIKEHFERLGRLIKIDEEKVKDIKNISTKDLNTTDLARIITVVNRIVSYKKYKEKSLESGLHTALNVAVRVLRSIAKETLGKDYEKYFKNVPIT